MDPDLWLAEVSRGARLVKSKGIYSITTHRASYVGRPVLRLRWDHVGLRGWSGPDRGELTGELTAIDRGDRRDDGTHRTSVPAIRRGFSASFSRTRGDARSLRAVGLEDTSRGQKKRGFPAFGRRRTEPSFSRESPWKEGANAKVRLGIASTRKQAQRASVSHA